MSNAVDFEPIRTIIERCQSPISTEAVLRQAGGTFTLQDLIEYWKKGKLYASEVGMTRSGYVPAVSGCWSLTAQPGYFAHSDLLGAYQVTEAMPGQIDATPIATIGLDTPIFSAAVHPDRDQVALGSRNGKIALCRVSEARIVDNLIGSASRTWTMAYTPSGDFLISGHQNGDLLKWQGGEIVQSAHADDWVRSISFSPSGAKFLTSLRVKKNANPSLFEWDLDALQAKASFIHTPETTWSVRYLQDGTGFVSAGSDYKVTVWSLEQHAVLWSEKKHMGTVIVLALHPMGGIVASGAWTGSLKMWDLETGADVVTIEAHQNRVHGLAFSPSGHVLASGSKDSQICLWQMPAGIAISRFTAHVGWVRAVEFLDEDTLLSIGSDGLCKIWKLSRAVPLVNPPATYQTASEVLSDYRRIMAHDDE